MLDKSQRLKEALLNNPVYLLEPDMGYVVGNFLFTTEDFKKILQENLEVVRDNNLITGMGGIEIIVISKEMLLIHLESLKKRV